MIIRIVKMSFQAEKVNDFLANFERNKEAIRAFPGCKHLKLLRDVQQPNTFFTYSYWESVGALNAYRDSDLFGGVWRLTKTFFSEKPEAWSVEPIEVLQ